jgi:murein L,D-transpeptidase YcbB/YkuD
LAVLSAWRWLRPPTSSRTSSSISGDLSHGCIRVEKPAELAAWVQRDKPEWNVERALAAMTSGKDNLQVNLTDPIPVPILYGTAVVDPDGRVSFCDDIYGYRDELQKALAKGYPYPG